MVRPPSISLSGLIVILASTSTVVVAQETGTAPPLEPTVSGPVFRGAAPDETHPWAVHDRNRPQPERVEPGTFSSQETPGVPPSDAVVLFDGTAESLANWKSTRDGGSAPMEWKVVEGALTVEPRSGGIRTRKEFGDVQLHIEWLAPENSGKTGQGRSNSGVFLMGMTEIQILDNYQNPTYADGSAGSVYGVNPPMVNPLRPPGQWQTYDIVFRRPVFEDGREVDPGRFTVFINGVLVQDSTPLEGGGGHLRRSQPREFPQQGPLMLQDHGDVLKFRNIWVRPLPPRAIEGGTDGQLDLEATAAKRRRIAAGIRAHAATLEGREQMMRYLESLAYQTHEDARTKVDAMTAAEVEELQALSEEELEARKGEVRQFERALHYLAEFDALPQDYPARVAVDAIVEKMGWNE